MRVPKRERMPRHQRVSHVGPQPFWSDQSRIFHMTPLTYICPRHPQPNSPLVCKVCWRKDHLTYHITHQSSMMPITSLKTRQ
jgi:hypothetical protein